MTDTQFQVLDELYFVTSFSELVQACGLPEPELAAELEQMLQQGLVRALYPHQDAEQPYLPEHFRQHHRQYYFLASKAGLLAHNSR